ncbi:MAG: ABC transporter permease/substrate-binding protein [Pyrinomonadaceae bacterium]
MNAWLQFLQANGRELLGLIREHFVLVFISTSIAVLIGLPAGVLLTRYPRLRGPVLGLANIMQTVPSLALFGLLIPLPFIGGIGARTAIVALVLYALLPIIRNTVTGILGVDPNVREAAVAMGMTDRQILWQVELPLAMSVILTGVRVAVVISVGVATIAALVGAGGLGTYIFRGVRQYDNHLILAGAVPAALMALLADFLLGLLEKRFDTSVRPNRARGRRYVLISVAAVLVLLFSGLYLTQRLRQSNASTNPGQPKVIVASKDFTESIILAEIFAQMLEARGITVERQFELGGNVPHDGMINGKIDAYPEYTGTAFTAILKHPPITDTQAVYAQVKREYAEQFKIVVGPPLGFSNDFAILVRGEEARRLNLKTISDAAPYAKNWRAGFGQDFMSRADGYAGFSKAYGLQFAARPSEMDLSLTYQALKTKQVDLIAGNSTDGLIAALDLFQLSDDKHYFPPYQAVLLVRQYIVVRVPAVGEVLNRLNNVITTEAMRKLNFEVDGKKRFPKDVVHEWLSAQGL